jgi:hypothetical protein
MGANRGSTSKRASARKNGADTEASGANRIRSEASRVLKERGQKIVEKLGEKAADGDLKSVELLYKLSQEDKKQEDGSPLTYKLAARLATEPEWQAEAKSAGDCGQDTRGDVRSNTDAAQAD